MTAEELIKNKPSEVRINSSLMAAYFNYYLEYMGLQLSCGTCNFESVFNTFANKVREGEPQFKYLIKSKMEQTFIVIDENKIFSYRSTKTGDTEHRYGFKMDEEFAIEYLTNGTEDEIESRKLEFSKLPEFQTELKVEMAATVSKKNK